MLIINAKDWCHAAVTLAQFVRAAHMPAQEIEMPAVVNSLLRSQKAQNVNVSGNKKLLPLLKV